MERLKKNQKEALLAWIAEGLESDEINERAAKFKPPFSVTRQNVDRYRKRVAVDLEEIRRAGSLNALSEGLALKEVRVKRLQHLAALMERDLFGGFLWTEQVKGLGGGEFMQVVDYEEFNAAEVREYRGVLDDIAKEMGHRRQGIDLGGEVKVTDARDRLAHKLDSIVAANAATDVPAEPDG